VEVNAPKGAPGRVGVEILRKCLGWAANYLGCQPASDSSSCPLEILGPGQHADAAGHRCGTECCGNCGDCSHHPGS